MHVVVLGAGVIGVTTAYYLSERGHSVTVVDRGDSMASGASGGNGGQLSYSFTDAMASPALLSKFPGIIAGLNPAFYVRPPINPGFIRWGLAFLSQCTHAKNKKSTAEILKLALRSGELMTRIRAHTAVQFSHRRAGKLVMQADLEGLAEAEKVCALKRQYGCDARVVTLEQAVEIEPALAQMQNNYVGAIYSESDEVGNPLTFTSGLGEWLGTNRDTEFRLNTSVRKIVARNQKLVAVETDQGTLKADAVVVCLGAWSNKVLDPLGIRTNIYPMRGYSVTLAEASRELGGRVSWESSLPGLAEWSRVRDWRIAQLGQLPNVEVYQESQVDAEQILAFESDRVALATGSEWRRDGVGIEHARPIPGWQSSSVLTPDDIAGGATPEGPILIFDNDHYYLGGVLAEQLAVAGCEVRLVTPKSLVSDWTRHTDEQHRIQARLIELGIQIEVNTVLEALEGEEAILSCAFTERTRRVEAPQVLMVTSRSPRDALYHELAERIDITRIGDCLAPRTIAACVHSGHAYARDMDDSPPPPRREESTLSLEG
jgi:glycine/D-amino acid oxidase-like deaminating enzyme